MDITQEPFFQEFWTQASETIRQEWKTFPTWKQRDLYENWYRAEVLLQDTSEDQR